jgi:hypothetical protein
MRIFAHPLFAVGLQMKDGTRRSGLLTSRWPHNPQNSSPPSG